MHDRKECEQEPFINTTGVLDLSCSARKRVEEWRSDHAITIQSRRHWVTTNIDEVQNRTGNRHEPENNDSCCSDSNDFVIDLQDEQATTRNADDGSMGSRETGHDDPVVQEGRHAASSTRYDGTVVDNQVAAVPESGPIQKRVDGVVVSLHDDALWKAFNKCGTEMIINRGGRRMFPHAVMGINGLNPNAMYSLMLKIVPADDRRYKFIGNQWIAMGVADPEVDNPPYLHHDSPSRGSYWMQGRVSFAKLKLTNNKESSEGNILLHSMHKYKAVLIIRNESLPSNNIITVDFPESTFVAVTAYQNELITQMKIHNNPFAKAFRDANTTAVIENGVPQKRKHTQGKHFTNVKRCRDYTQTSMVPSPFEAVQYHPYCTQTTPIKLKKDHLPTNRDGMVYPGPMRPVGGFPQDQPGIYPPITSWNLELLEHYKTSSLAALGSCLQDPRQLQFPTMFNPRYYGSNFPGNVTMFQNFLHPSSHLALSAVPHVKKEIIDYSDSEDRPSQSTR